MSLDHIDQMVRQANPVPDPAVMESWIEEREERPHTTTTTHVDRPVSRLPHRLIWSSAALVVVISIGVFAVAQSTPGPQTTSDDASTEFADMVASVEEMLLARNGGTFAEWRSHFAEFQPTILRGPVYYDSDLDWHRSAMAANETWVLTGECVPGPGQETHLLCPLEMTNDYWGPAGIMFAVEASFTFDESGLISDMTAVTTTPTGDPLAFISEFQSWLASTHPEIHESLGPAVDGEGTPPRAEDMPKVLPYVDEFVEQSEKYPLSGS